MKNFELSTLSTLSTLTTGVEADDIEILLYRVGPYLLAINLWKVREITPLLPVKSIPYSHPLIEGVFELRQRLHPLLNLRRWLRLEPVYPGPAPIVTAQFLGLSIGIRVDGVEGIKRFTRRDVQAARRSGGSSDCVVATVKHQRQLAYMLDYERMVREIKPEEIARDVMGKQDGHALMKKRKSKSLWLIEGSAAVRKYLKNLLVDGGYGDIVFFENPRHALDTLTAYKKRLETGEADAEAVALIITGTRMPLMDGYAFVRFVKQDPYLKRIPVIIYSSLTSPEETLKGEIVKADARLSKSESISLPPLIDRLLFL